MLATDGSDRLTDKGRLLSLQWRDFTEAQPGPMSLAADTRAAPFAILPVGATEQHGGVLPVGTDWMVATELAVGVGAALGGYVLPPIPIGTSMEQRGSNGTAWLRPETLANVVRDVSDSLATWGMTRLAIISGHGGNFILGPTVRELNADHPERLVVVVPERIKHGADGLAPDDLHAGAREVSMGAHLFGSPVPGTHHDFVPDAHRDELNHRALLEISPTGVWGRPSQADAAQGEKDLDDSITRITDFLREVLL